MCASKTPALDKSHLNLAERDAPNVCHFGARTEPRVDERYLRFRTTILVDGLENATLGQILSHAFQVFSGAKLIELIQQYSLRKDPRVANTYLVEPKSFLGSATRKGGYPLNLAQQQVKTPIVPPVLGKKSRRPQLQLLQCSQDTSARYPRA